MNPLAMELDPAGFKKGANGRTASSGIHYPGSAQAHVDLDICDSVVAGKPVIDPVTLAARFPGIRRILRLIKKS